MTYESNSQGTKRGGSSPNFIGALDGAIRDNPIPAALVGLGILWLLAGGRNVVLGGASQAVVGGIGRGAYGAGGAAFRGARAATGRVADGIGAVAESASDIGNQATGAIRSAADSVGGAVNRAGEWVGEATSQAASSWAGDSRDTDQYRQSAGVLRGGASFGSARDALADLFTRQPLMLGAVGVAIGAAIAASLPLSEGENRLMGDTADAVKDQADKLWDEAKRRGSALASKGLEEAGAQGLTPEAASKAARTVVTKVAGFAEKASNDIVNRTRR